jgi:hypothetical protein
MPRTNNNNFELYRQQHRDEIAAAFVTLGAHPEAPRAAVRRQWTGLYRRWQGGNKADVVRLRKLLEEAGLFW